MMEKGLDFGLLPGRAGEAKLDQAAFWCAFGSAWASVFSIAVSQSLLGLAIAALLIQRRRWALPPHPALLGFFVVWTIAAWLASGDLVTGLPQIRKLYVWLLLPVMLTLFRNLSEARLLVGAWCAAGTAAALRGCWQFGAKWMQAAAAGEDFYQSYVGARITGFMSHWMTFSGQMMVVLLAGAALLVWGRPGKKMRWFLIAALPAVALAILLGFTRGVWLATAMAVVYLLWRWRRWTVALVPAALLVAFVAGPAGVRARMMSLVRPHGQTDSNQHRVVTFRTGIEMIKAHPWLGLGPEQVGRQFERYVPEGISRPLPVGFYGHLHNVYVQIAAERGLPALAALLLWLGANMRDWWRVLRRLKPEERERRWVLEAGMAVMTGILATALFEHNLGDSEILALTLAVIAAATLSARGPAYAE